MPGRYLDALVPPGAEADAPLRAALARDAAKRLTRALAAWRRLDAGAPALRRFAGMEPASGRFRCWLAEVEDAIAIARERGRAPLIDLVADAGFLAQAAPSGRIPRDFTRRAHREALRSLRASAAGLGEEPAPFGRLLQERGTRTIERARVPRFEARVGRAMTLLESAWPEAASMIRSRVWRIVPVAAEGTVSYSGAREPGIAYIHVASAPDVRMAEDLVHESTHMRLHEIEALHPLVTRAALGAPRFYSPWRREWRPLRGLVHAACTFTVGAMYFERMLASGARLSASRRRWLARRLLEERASVAIALRALRGASRNGFLTASGRRVLAAVAREHAGLAARARRRQRWLASTAAGRRELSRVAALVSRLRSRPLRWSWEARS